MKILKIYLILCVFLVACKSENSNKIKIGAIASLTGPANQQGQNWLNGALLAQDQLKDQGIDFDLIIEDDATNPSKAVSAFAKLANFDRVDLVLGGTWDYLGESIYPLAAQYRVPLITMTNAVEVLSSSALSNPYVFTNAMSLRAESDAVEKFLANENIKTIALSYPNLPFGTQHADIVRKLAQKNKIEILSDQEFSMEGYYDSLRPIALRISKLKPDLLYIVLDYAGLEILTKEFQNLKVQQKFLTTQHLDQAFKLSDHAARYRNAYAVYPQVEDLEFVKAFKTKFGEDPRVFATHGYDAMNFAVKALKAGIRLSDANAKFSYQGLTGLHQLNPNSRSLVDNKAQIVSTESGAFAFYCCN